jgi:hypothetical protein
MFAHLDLDELRRQAGGAVVFLRPDGGWECKSRAWCIDNDFEQVAPGIWSGYWYDGPYQEVPPPLRRQRPAAQSNKCAGGCGQDAAKGCAARSCGSCCAQPKCPRHGAGARRR